MKPLATSGTIYGSCKHSNGSVTSKYNTWIDWKRDSVNTAGNTSRITVYVRVQRTDGYSDSAANLAAKPSVTLSVGGVAKTPTIDYINTRNSVVCTFATWSGDVAHAPDGTLSLSVSCSWTLTGTNSLGAGSIIGTATLDTIPRASTISCTETNIESKPTITISRASSSFTHTVAYKFGSLSGTIVEKTSATSITSWTIPESFYTQIPNAQKGKGTLTCTTYSGNTAIGTSQCDLSVTTDRTKCSPTVSGSVVDTNPKTVALTESAATTLVRFFSTASCTINVTLNKSAGGVLLKTINNISLGEGNALEIPNVETGIFDFYAKDSREYPGEDKEERILVPYIKLTNEASISRDDPTSGNATLKIEGNYYDGSFGAQNNSLTVQYKEGDGDYIPVTPTISNNRYSIAIPLTGYDYTRSFNFEVVVSDKLDEVPKPLTLLKGIPVFDWGESDFKFNVPVTINGVDILKKLAELEERISS